MISIRQVLLICCSILLFTASLSGVVVDLQDPLYTDGMLKTEHGGVIHSEGMRIQARKILYIRRGEPGDLVHTIEAEGELVIDYGRYLLVGTRLFYDFEAKRGVLENGRTALWPWNFGGREIQEIFFFFWACRFWHFNVCMYRNPSRVSD